MNKDNKSTIEDLSAIFMQAIEYSNKNEVDFFMKEKPEQFHENPVIEDEEKEFMELIKAFEEADSFSFCLKEK